MADDQGPGGGARVISIPGVLDVLAIPPLEDAQLKRERLTRWRINAERSTIPEPLRWLPQVINWLDDAQDLLSVALIAGKPLLRRLPGRFIPYLGWALLANDVANLLTGFLSAPLNPRSLKAEFYRTTRNAVAGRTARVRAAEAFLLPGRTRFLPFALTAGQVLYSFTGWGLRLGAVMQTVSETWWGLVASLKGEHVVIQGPPPSDPAAKAARFLAQSLNWNAVAQIANATEIGILMAAGNLAMGLLGAPTPVFADDDRLRELADNHVPTYTHWNTTTKTVLLEAGYPQPHDQRTAVPTIAGRPKYSDAMQVCLAAAPDIDVLLAQEHRNTFQDWPMGMMASELSQYAWDAFGAGVDVVVPLNSPMERMLGIALEQGIVPPFFAIPLEPQIKAILHLGHADDESGQLGYMMNDEGTLWQHGYHFPIAYPPPHPDPNAQIAHWCAIGLALYCRRRLAYPGYHFGPERNRVSIDAWGHGGPGGLDCMKTASILVWGNFWVRRFGPDEYKPEVRTEKPNTCVPNPSGWPGLSGRIPEWEPLQEVLNHLPTFGKPPVPIGTDNYDVVQYQSRDWLDAYLRELDTRRQTGPKSPDPAGLPEPLTPQEGWWWQTYWSHG